jgi:PTH1 family peptidyl-tRNA hydrolase
MKLFVGLGNPGPKYARNRHNVGFMALDRLAERHGAGPWRRRFQGETAELRLGTERVTLLKPSTYMNDSGQSVGEAQRFLKIPVEDVYVFHDEIDLAPSKLKVKAGGGNAGHNGLRSISAHIGNDYNRVRIGVGHPGAKEAVAYYVLHDFAKAESSWLEPLLDAMSDSVRFLAAGDSARFLSHVASDMRTLDAEDEEPQSPEPKRAAAPPRRKEPSSSAKPHPAGERAAKRAGALAENLKKWLAGREPKD